MSITFPVLYGLTTHFVDKTGLVHLVFFLYLTILASLARNNHPDEEVVSNDLTLHVNQVLFNPGVPIRHVGARKHLKHAGQGALRTRIGNPWFNLNNRTVLLRIDLGP